MRRRTLKRSSPALSPAAPLPRDPSGRADAIWPPPTLGGDVDALGDLWQQATQVDANAQTKERGQYFTPRELATRMVKLALAPFTPTQSHAVITVLDPACGHGAFLLAAIQWAARLGCRVHLVGCDIDAEVAGRARQILRRAVKRLGVDAAVEVRCADALDPATGFDGFDFDGFDAVVGNPPWVSYSGRHAANIDVTMRQRLTQRFAGFRSWPCLHVCFVERGLGLLKVGGRLGFLLPTQVASLSRYAGLRNLVNAQAWVDPASFSIEEGVFAGVVSETFGLLATRIDASPKLSQAWLASPAGPLDAAEGALLDALPRVPSSCFADLGVHSGNAAKLLIHESGPKHWPAILEGRDLQPFICARPRRVLNVDLPVGAGLRFRIGDAKRLREVPILLRQTASRPVAAPNPGLLFRNSVLAGWPWPGFDLWGTLALLNSQLLAQNHLRRWQEAGQRTFPQLKIGHLRALPMPIAAGRKGCRQLSELGQLAARGGRNDELEAAVRRIYGLGDAG